MTPPQPHRQRGLALTSFVALLSIGSRRFDQVDGESRRQVEDILSLMLWPMSTSSFITLAAAASTQQHHAHNNNESAEEETSLPARPLNYYELLNLETPDTHRRPKTKALHNRKKRSIYRSKITTSDIKKAYRKQAQLYHPDKASRHNKTLEEATSRFAEIAEAYQVLVDPVQRHEYDWELLAMEEEYEAERLLLEEQQQEVQRQQRRQQQQYRERQHGMGTSGDDFSLYNTIKNGASNLHAWKDTLNLDPWKVFEDFFFQESTMFGDNINSNSNSNSYYADNFESSNSQQQRWAPPRVSETTIHRGYDVRFGADLYTVLRKEEYSYDVNHNGEYYYQVLAQDFIAGTRVDPYTGFSMQEYYSAVTEPYFVEDGYTKLDFDGGGSKYGNANVHYRNQPSQQPTQREANSHRASRSKLEVGESFRPADGNGGPDPWISPNGKYQAMLTPSCELQLVRRKESINAGDADDANTIIWSSETYIPNVRAHGCYLTLNSLGRLVLSVDYGSGLDSVGNTVLWNTPLPQVVPHWINDDDNSSQQHVTFHYYASVDDDGVLAVYRARERKAGGAGAEKQSNAKNTTTGEFIRANLQMRPILDKLGGMYHRISKASEEQGQTKATIVWNHLRYNIGRILSISPTYDQQSYLSSSRDECIYSTSPVGCLAPGRNAIRLTKNIARSINSHLDQFLAALTEPVSGDDYDDYGHHFSGYESSSSDFGNEEDEDMLDTLIRVTGAAGAQLGKAGSVGIHAAQLGMKRGKNVAGKMVGKMKDRLGKHSVRWGERLVEED